MMRVSMADQPFNFGLWAAKIPNTELGTMLAGAGGSLITLRFLGPMPWYERLILVLGGTLITHYTTPLAIYWLNLTKYQNSIAFLIGVFGMSTVGALLQILSAIGANPFEWLRVVLNRVKTP